MRLTDIWRFFRFRLVSFLTLAAKMSSMDLEKLKMTGAGRAIAVLTSGGDAQGHYKVNHITLKSLKTQELMLFYCFSAIAFGRSVFQ